MSRDDPWYFWTGGDPPIRLQLHRWNAGSSSPRENKPVLLLHGASANHGTFTVEGVGLAPWLAHCGFDPWLLDWRGSSRVVEDSENGPSLEEQVAYNFNRAAAEDLPEAIRHMRVTVGTDTPIGLFGHCMGAAVVAEAVALGHLEGCGVDRIVLSALGLFYETPIDSRLKSEERILERLSKVESFINPITSDGVTDGFQKAWHPELNGLYDAWPPALRFHNRDVANRVNDMCDRVSFMYGLPYHHGNLVKAIHGTGDDDAELLNQFGAIPLRMFLHAAKNVRRGRATFDESTDDDGSNDDKFVSDGARKRFMALEKVTLITGELNRLWHRDSIDRMHEWLCRGPSSARRRFSKRIFQNYAHQDLLWGTAAPNDIFPTIAAGLRA